MNITQSNITETDNENVMNYENLPYPVIEEEYTQVELDGGLDYPNCEGEGSITIAKFPTPPDFSPH